MSYTLEQFAADIHETLKADPGPGGQEKVLDYVRKALKDDDFVAANVPESLPEDRNVIYQDEELGFLICAHNNPGAKKGYPHDHGSTWAIYGQAAGQTVMTEFEQVAAPDGDAPGKVKPTKSYDLDPGMAVAYPIGRLHSPKRAGETRLIRIEGKDVTKLKRDAYERA